MGEKKLISCASTELEKIGASQGGSLEAEMIQCLVNTYFYVKNVDIAIKMAGYMIVINEKGFFSRIA